jgi:transposase-like protein
MVFRSKFALAEMYVSGVSTRRSRERRAAVRLRRLRTTNDLERVNNEIKRRA